MPTQHPTVVRRSFIALVLFALVASCIVAGLIANVMQKKKEKEQVVPITIKKVMPVQYDSGSNMPVRRKQSDQSGEVANEVALNKHNLSVSNGGHELSVK